jgi:hypothetical protein
LDGPLNLLRLKRAELIALVCQLQSENLELRKQADGIIDTIIPYTLEEDRRRGDTIMVRVPRKYRPLESC